MPLTPTILVNKLARDPVMGREYLKLNHIGYRSYRLLRRDLKNQLEQSHDGEVHVARSRRGQGGEWFEVWQLDWDKPVIIREGWQ